jgi:hypothetical protein
MMCEMLHSDKELPVRVEAAMALQDLITDRENGNWCGYTMFVGRTV